MEYGFLRPLIFVVGLVLFSGMGVWFPRRALGRQRLYFVIQNLILGGLNPILLRFLFGSGLLSWAYYVENENWGLLNFIEVGLPLKIIVTLVLFDLGIYWQHRVFHIVPVFWRVHRVHHTDTEFDTSLALRFHFFEAFISYFFKILLIFVVGAPAIAIFIFEVVLNFSAMFNHSNWFIKKEWDDLLRKIFVTPDFHRVHHSIHKTETNSNYGFCLPWWDYLFQSYVKSPKEGHCKMKIGVEEFRSQAQQNVLKLWVQPFKKG